MGVSWHNWGSDGLSFGLLGVYMKRQKQDKSPDEKAAEHTARIAPAMT
jgi:hypothetical protein